MIDSVYKIISDYAAVLEDVYKSWQYKYICDPSWQDELGSLAPGYSLFVENVVEVSEKAGGRRTVYDVELRVIIFDDPPSFDNERRLKNKDDILWKVVDAVKANREINTERIIKLNSIEYYYPKGMVATRIKYIVRIEKDRVFP